MGWVHIALRTVPDITISPQLKNLREFGWGILPPTHEGVFFPARGGPTPLLESAPLRRCVLFRLQAFRPPRMPLAESHAAGSTIAGGAWPVTLMRIFRAMLNLCINATVVRRKSCPDQPDMPVSPVQAHG
jgi:hypothetical protein